MTFNNEPEFNFSPNFNNTSNNSGYSTTQRIQMVEALCEGPVWGLTEGSASVYFNNTRAIEVADATHFNNRDVSDTDDLASFQFEGEITFSGSSTTGSISPSAAEDVIGTYDEESGCIISVVHTTLSDVVISNIVYTEPSFAGQVGMWTGVLTSSSFNSSLDTKGFTTVQAFQVYLTDSAGNFVLATIVNDEDGTARVVYFSPVQTFTNSQSLGVTISANVTVEEITENSITLLTNGAPTAGTYSYNVTKVSSAHLGDSVSPGIDEAKTENLNIQFVNGSAIQTPIYTWGGAGGGINVPVSQQPSNTLLKQLQASVAESENLSLFSTAGYQEGRSNAEDGAASPVIIQSSLFSAQQRQLIREQADVLSFEIKYGRLQALDTINGGETTNTAIYAVDIAFQDEAGGDFSDYESVFNNVIHTANFGAALSWQHFVDLGAYRKTRGFYDFKIRIARLTRHIDNAVQVSGMDYTGEDVDTYDQSNSEARVVSIIATVKDNLYYPYTSLAGVSFNSTQFDRIPKLSYDMRGKLVKVPTSYTPREYTENNLAVYADWWEGDFKDQLQFTDNPAWVFYDIRADTRCGLGE